MGLNPGFWKDRRVLVTGHTGFKGSWLCLWLQTLGARVVGYALPAEGDLSLFHMARVADGMVSIEGDVRDLECLRRTVREHSPEVALHLAAQALVRESYREPVLTYATNVMGTVHLLEALRDAPDLKSVVLVTTDKCYAPREWPWGYREEDHLGGFDPYASSKACAELVASAYRSSFFSPESYDRHGVAIATARAGNVIGGGDYAADRLVPDILRAIVSREAARIRQPGAVRPWQHVLEPLSGYLLLAERLYQEGSDYGAAWNFGPADSEARPVSWIADRLVELWGDGAAWEHDGAEHPHETHALRLDSSKARQQLGWKPRLGLEAALEWIVDWNRMTWRDQAAAREASLSQITRFMALGIGVPRSITLDEALEK